MQQAERKLAQDRQLVLTLKTDLEAARPKYEYGGKTYTPQQLRQDLAAKFARYQVADENVKTLGGMLQAREQRLAATRQKLDTMVATKQQLEIQVEHLQVRLRQIEIAQAAGDARLDATQVSEARTLIDEIQTRLTTPEGLRRKLVTTQPGLRCLEAVDGDRLVGGELPLFQELFVLDVRPLAKGLTHFLVSRSPRKTHQLGFLGADNSAHPAGSSKNPHVAPADIVRAARAKGVAIHAVAIRGGGGDDEQRRHYSQRREVAEATGGNVYGLADAGRLAAQIAQVVQREHAVVRKNRDELQQIAGGRMTVQQYLASTDPNGSGKSTLLTLLGALDVPTSGRIFYRGEPMPFADRRAMNRLPMSPRDSSWGRWRVQRVRCWWSSRTRSCATWSVARLAWVRTSSCCPCSLWPLGGCTRWRLPSSSASTCWERCCRPGSHCGNRPWNCCDESPNQTEMERTMKRTDFPKYEGPDSRQERPAAERRRWVRGLAIAGLGGFTIGLLAAGQVGRLADTIGTPWRQPARHTAGAPDAGLTPAWSSSTVRS